jgi:hypothetical protein
VHAPASASAPAAISATVAVTVTAAAPSASAASAAFAVIKTAIHIIRVVARHNLSFSKDESCGFHLL